MDSHFRKSVPVQRETSPVVTPPPVPEPRSDTSFHTPIQKQDTRFSEKEKKPMKQIKFYECLTDPEQDTRFSEKEKKLIKKIKFYECLTDPINSSEYYSLSASSTASHEDSTETVEELSDDSDIIVLQSTNDELRQIVTKSLSTPEGVSIYEDDFTDDQTNSPKKYKPGGSSYSRAPLFCMKNKTDSGHTQSKSEPKRQPNDKKIARRVSYIPRLKSLSKQTKLNVNCENTPPYST